MITYPNAAELGHLLGGKRVAKGWIAQCPAHEDRQASLSISDGDDGRVLWYCHAGCTQEAVRDALLASGHLPRRDPPARVPRAAAPSASGAPVAIYAYRDATGRVIHETLRYEPKSFRQRAVTESGYVWSLAGVQTVLYRLPELITSTGPVWLVEGEKDADNLARLGATVTTVPMGAGKWHDRYADAVRGRVVRIIPDNDAPGIKGAERIAQALTGVASSVSIVTLPVVGKGADVSDWIAQGGTLEALERLAQSAPAYRAPVPDAPDARAIDHQPLTDSGNAERMIARHGENLRYVHAWKTWLIWDGMRWRPDGTGGPMRLALETIRELTNVASADRSPDMPSARRTALVRHAERSESRQRLQAMVALAQDLPGVGILPDQLDRNEWLLNVATGTVDLRTRTLAPHTRADYITRIVAYKGRPLPWVPDLHPDAPLFWQFLNRIQPDPAVRHFLRRALGYSITGSTRERRLFVCHGVGRNGKTTLLELVRDIIGEGFCQVLPSELLMARKNQSHAGSASPDLAALHGTRYVICAETDQGGRLNEGRVKWLTGDDTVQARRLFEAPFTFTPSHTVWLTTNHRPQVRDGGEALWDRLILIPFETRITDEEQDKSLPQRLRDEEAEGVLDWLIEGAHHWYRDGLQPPKRVLAATDSYREESDWFGEFIDHACEVGEGLQVLSAALHKAYTDWAQASSERLLNPVQLGSVLRERGFVPSKAAKGRRLWTGLRLLTHTQGDSEPDAYPEL